MNWYKQFQQKYIIYGPDGPPNEPMDEDENLIAQCQLRATGANTHSINGWLGKYRGSLMLARDGYNRKVHLPAARTAEAELRRFLATGEIKHL